MVCFFSLQLSIDRRSEREGGKGGGVGDEANIYVNWHVGNNIAWDTKQMVFITQRQQNRLE